MVEEGNLGHPEGNPEDPAEVSENEVAAAIALVLAGKGVPDGMSREAAIRGLLMQLPDTPEPEAATEAARMIVQVDKANGQSSPGV